MAHLFGKNLVSDSELQGNGVSTASDWRRGSEEIQCKWTARKRKRAERRRVLGELPRSSQKQLEWATGQPDCSLKEVNENPTSRVLARCGRRIASDSSNYWSLGFSGFSAFGGFFGADAFARGSGLVLGPP